MIDFHYYTLLLKFLLVQAYVYHNSAFFDPSGTLCWWKDRGRMRSEDLPSTSTHDTLWGFEPQTLEY